MNNYEIRKIKDVYKGKLLNIELKEVVFPDGKSALREIVVHPGAVAIVPFVDEGHLILIEQFRTPANQVLWELPAGSIEKGELPIECAKRELIEEIGYEAGRLEEIACFFLAPGYSTEIMHLFKGYELTKKCQQLEDDERIAPHIFSIDEAVSLLKSGKILDAKTIIGLSMVLK